MTVLLALAMLAQTFGGARAYTMGDPIQLVMANGTYAIELGSGCDSITAGVNVEVLAGSGGVAAIVPLDSDALCNVYISDKVSDSPCAMNADGECDIEGQQ